MLLVTVVFGASAQYRWNGYPSPYQRLQRNMEHNQNRDRIGYRNGDSKLVLNLDYGISLPMGDLHQYVDKPSFNGWNASLLYQINPKIAAGLGIGFYDYYQKLPRTIYQDKTTSISAVQTHIVQYVPIQPTLLYTPNGGKKGVQPYVGLGIGGALVNYEKYWGVFVDKNNKFGFSVSPMAGVLIPFTKTSRLKLNIGVRYNYATFSYQEIKNLSNMEANIGISLHLK